jgi:hypothetical protein
MIKAVLEMHFHSALLDVIRANLGLGNGGLNFYKFSPQKECFVGFDQAFVRTDLSPDQLFGNLKESAEKRGYSLGGFFFGFFLQYKVVRIMQKRSRHTPASISQTQHLRVPLETRKNTNSGFSQHELLYNLAKNRGAEVYYACPMLFDRMQLYSPPNLDLLRLVDTSSCRSSFTDNEKHFIYFSEPDARPIWCSEPVQGEAVTPAGFAKRIRQLIASDGTFETQTRLLEYLFDTGTQVPDIEEKRSINLMSESFTLIESLSIIE